MSHHMTLGDLKPGRSALVTEVRSDENAMARRLKDLGLIPGTWVTCVASSPAGDPSAYWIRGAVIAIRRKDAAGIYIRPGGLASEE